MIKLDIKLDTKGIERKLNDLVRKQLPFATAQAVNDVARQAKADVREAMGKAFDRPTSRTLNSVKVEFATKEKPEARVWIDAEPNKGTAPAKYLEPQILGGARNHKRFERALQAKGLMPSGTFAVPGSAAPLDSYGNIPGSFIVQLLSYFQSFGEQGYRANMTKKRIAKIHGMTKSEKGFKKVGGVMYFVSNGQYRNAHLKPGIYSKTGTHGSNIKPVILFVGAANYKARLPFSDIVGRTVKKHLGARLEARLAKALATAK